MVHPIGLGAQAPRPTGGHGSDIRTPVGTRFTYVVKEGRCEGPKIAGDILPGGGDWILLGSDRVGRLDVRATLRTDDGAHIYLTNTGRVRMNAEVAQRFAAGEFIPHDEMYARSSPLLDWTLTATAVRWDCLDLVTVTDDWRVARKDTFVDGVQSARALGE